MLNDTVVSLIRTWVPIAVGVAVAWITDALGVEVQGEELTVTLVAIVTAAYYALARFLEKKWPVLGWLLGVPSEPAYSGTPPAGPAPSELT